MTEHRPEEPVVRVEESTLNGRHWAVVVARGEDRRLWGRYATQAEAELQAMEARAWLFDNPDGDLPTLGAAEPLMP